MTTKPPKDDLEYDDGKEAELPSFVRNLRRFRRDRGWSKTEACTRSGISIQLLSQMESGKRANPTLETLQALAVAYGVTIDELASDPEPTPPALQGLIDTGVLGEIDLETLRKLKAVRGLLGVEPSARDYVVLLDLIRQK